MGKGKKAAVAAGGKESNGKNQEIGTIANVVTEPVPPLPLLIEEQSKDEQNDDPLDADAESESQQQTGQGVEEASFVEKAEEAKVDNDTEEHDDHMDNNDISNNIASVVESNGRMKWRGLFIYTLAFLLALSNGYTLHLYNQTRAEQQALVLTAETLRDGNREVSRYYKRQLLHKEKDAQHLESEIAVYQLRLQKALAAETEKYRALQEQLHHSVQTERIACEKRVQQEQASHEQVLQSERQVSQQQQQDFEQHRVQLKEQTKQLQNELKTVQATLQVAHEELALRQTELHRQQEENEKLTKFKTKATADLEKARKGNRNLVSENEKYKAEIVKLQKRMDVLQQETNEVQTAWQQSILDVQTCRHEHELVVQELNTSQEQLNQVQVHLVVLQETVTSLGHDLAEEFLQLESVSESKESILRETIATLELERQQFNATLQRTKLDLQKVQHVINEKLVKANEKSILERKVVASQPREEQQEPPRSSSGANSNISDTLRADDQVHGDSPVNEKDSDNMGTDQVADHDDDEKSPEKRNIGTVTLDDNIAGHSQQNEAGAPADEKDGKAASLNEDTTTTSSSPYGKEMQVGGPDATSAANDNAVEGAMTDSMKEEHVPINPEDSDVCVESTCSTEKPMKETIGAAKEQHDQQLEDESLTSEDLVASASTEKGKKNVVHKLQNFWRGLMKRKIDKTTLELALD